MYFESLKATEEHMHLKYDESSISIQTEIDSCFVLCNVVNELVYQKRN